MTPAYPAAAKPIAPCEENIELASVVQLATLGANDDLDENACSARRACRRILKLAEAGRLCVLPRTPRKTE